MPARSSTATSRRIPPRATAIILTVCTAARRWSATRTRRAPTDPSSCRCRRSAARRSWRGRTGAGDSASTAATLDPARRSGRRSDVCGSTTKRWRRSPGSWRRSSLGISSTSAARGRRETPCAQNYGAAPHAGVGLGRPRRPDGAPRAAVAAGVLCALVDSGNGPRRLPRLLVAARAHPRGRHGLDAPLSHLQDRPHQATPRGPLALRPLRLGRRPGRLPGVLTDRKENDAMRRIALSLALVFGALALALTAFAQGPTPPAAATLEWKPLVAAAVNTVGVLLVLPPPPAVGRAPAPRPPAPAPPRPPARRGRRPGAGGGGGGPAGPGRAGRPALRSC